MEEGGYGWGDVMLAVLRRVEAVLDGSQSQVHEAHACLNQGQILLQGYLYPTICTQKSAIAPTALNNSYIKPKQCFKPFHLFCSVDWQNAIHTYLIIIRD